MHRLCIHIAVFCLLFTLTRSVGQVRFEHFSVENGLSQNTILSLIQDREGYLWIGTEDGLNQYDGYTFKRYRSSSHDSTSLPDEQIWSLLEDDIGRIWIGHAKGISFYDKTDRRFHHVYLQENLFVVSSYQDSNKNIWFGTSGNGLIRVSHNTLEIKRYYNDTEPISPYDENTWKLVSNYFLSIAEFENGLLVGTRGGGIFRFSDGLFTRINVPAEFQDFIELNDSWSILRDDTKYYIGTVKGLGVFERDFSSGKIYTSAASAHTLSFNRIAKLHLDSDRNGMWIATYGGGLNFFHQPTEKFTSYQHSSEAQSISSNLAFTVLVDHTQNVWIGTWAGGLNKLNRNTLLFSTFNSNNGISDSYVTSISASGDTVFVGTYSGGVFFSTNNQKYEPVLPNQPRAGYIRSVFAGSKLWLGLDGGGVAYTDLTLKDTWSYYRKLDKNENSLNNHVIDVVLEDSFGTLWVGTRGSGLKRIYHQVPYGTSGSIQHFNSNPEDSTKLSDNAIMSLLVDRKNYLWVGTGNGLNRTLNPVTKNFHENKFIRYGDERITSLADGNGVLWVGTETGLFKLSDNQLLPVEGLEQDYINSIVEDKSGRLWLSTNHGIVSYNNGAVQRFTSHDGLQSNEFNVRAGCITADGNLVFGGVKGFNVFNPDELTKTYPAAKVVFTKILLNNKTELSSTDDVALHHTDKIITLEFSALDFTNPLLTQYQYRLEGFDESWIATSEGKREVTYTNLNPGSYTFKVKANNTQGIWSGEATLRFSVVPPPWKTWWAYMGYALVLLGLILAARKNIVNRERMAAEMRVEHLELEKLKELDEFKSAFFANISHEFRTPLTLIMGNAHEQLDKKEFNPDGLQSIIKNSESVLSLVNQMLDLSKLDAGRMKLNIESVNIVQFLKLRAGVFQSLAQHKDVALIEKYPSSELATGLDPSILEKVVYNLLSNAIKYTPSGGTVTFEFSIQDENLVLNVTDTGIGIGENHLPKIFDRFYRVSEYTEGTGIGLSLTRELVVLHGGEIKVTSEPGKGSHFTVILPLIPVDGVEETTIEAAKKFQNAYTPTSELLNELNTDAALPVVLIVEDNEELRNFIRRNLQTDYTTLAAPNGQLGLQLATQELPDLIITDWMMPGMTGVELCSALKSNESTSHIPVIVLTAKANVEAKLEGLNTGADDYLTKPFDIRELRSRVHNLIRQRSLLREKFSKEGLYSYKHVKVSSLDEKFLERFLRLLESKISDPALSVENLSREMGVSRMQLHRKLTALTGHSPGDLVREHRLHRAADLLRQKAGNVSEIAFHVGFDNLSYFTKAFRQKFRVAPSEFV